MGIPEDCKDCRAFKDCLINTQRHSKECTEQFSESGKSATEHMCDSLQKYYLGEASMRTKTLQDLKDRIDRKYGSEYPNDLDNIQPFPIVKPPVKFVNSIYLPLKRGD